MTLPPVIIVPDHRDDARAWQRVVNLLQPYAPDVLVVETAGDDLAADTARVAAALEAATEPPLLIAHGYGAVPATAATTRRNASHLIFVAGFMLDYGETIFDVVGGPAGALTRTPLDQVGWRALPTTYVVCTAGRRIAPAVQWQLALTRATTVVEIAAGDQPFRTHAEMLAHVVHEELVAVRGGQLHAALRLVKSA